METTANTLAQLAKEQGLPDKGVAIAIANTMVPRTAADKSLFEIKYWKIKKLNRYAKLIIKEGKYETLILYSHFKKW